LISVGVECDDRQLLNRQRVVSTVILALAVYAVVDDAVADDDTPEQSRGDGVQGQTDKQTLIVDIAHEVVLPYAVKPTAHLLVDGGVVAQRNGCDGVVGDDKPCWCCTHTVLVEG